MADEVKLPARPGTSAGLSILQSGLIIITGMGTIWTLFSKGGLTEAYNWINSIDGAPFLTSVGLLATVAWRAYTKWKDKKTIVQQHAAIEVAKQVVAPETVPIIEAVQKGEVK